MASSKRCKAVTDVKLLPAYLTAAGATPFELQGEDPPYPLYQSTFLETTVTGTFTLHANDFPCTLLVTITRGDGPDLTYTINSASTTRDINVTVASLRGITATCINCEASTADTCSGYYSLQLHWCKCCPA